MVKQEAPVVQRYFCFRTRQRRARYVRKFIRCKVGKNGGNRLRTSLDWDTLFAQAGIARPC